tara:strand:+ start:137 stop:460 length:324 start_codon:yes stop_codon:yes gene_type:complete
MTSTVMITLLLLAFINWLVFRNSKTKYCVARKLSPISMDMAVHYEHAKFRIRYRDLEPSQTLYKLGLRSGQFGVVLKHRTGMFAKTTVNGKCHFVRIEPYNYEPTGS